MSAPVRSTLDGRAAAVAAITAWLKHGDFPDRVLEKQGGPRAWAMELSYGAIRWHRLLAQTGRLLAPRAPPLEIEACLLAGLYQLLMLDDVEPYAAVHATVEIAKQRGGRRAADFVNAVLRSAQRRAEEIRARWLTWPEAVRWSHPDELVERWRRAFGPELTARLCEWNNERPEVILCVNPRRVEPATLASALAAAGIPARPHRFRPATFLVLPRGCAVAGLPGYAQGWFTVQDPATALAPELLAPRPGELVLDACAAPGGKIALLAAAMQKAETPGRLVGADCHADRLRVLRENLARLDLGWIEVRRLDATRAEEMARLKSELAPAGFDAVLLDVPCSNTGVLRRRPDARWRFSPGRLRRLAETQRGLLANAAQALRPGGRLVYSTCSLEAEENAQQIKQALADEPRLRLISEHTLFPPISGTDGAYAALLQRGP